jgi:hypothetical protein
MLEESSRQCLRITAARQHVGNAKQTGAFQRPSFTSLELLPRF